MIIYFCSIGLDNRNSYNRILYIRFCCCQFLFHLLLHLQTFIVVIFLNVSNLRCSSNNVPPGFLRGFFFKITRLFCVNPCSQHKSVTPLPSLAPGSKLPGKVLGEDGQIWFTLIHHEPFH